MRRCFLKIKGKRGAEVVQSLIIIAIMGSLAITVLAALNNKIVDKATITDTTIINSQSIDVDHVIGELNKK